MKATNDPVKRDKADVGRVLCFGDPEWGSVGDQHIKLAAGPDPFEPGAKLKAEDAPSHLRLRVLVGTRLIPKAAAQPGDAHAAHLGDSTINVVATLRSRDGDLRLQR
jgi:hypothetical protein